MTETLEETGVRGSARQYELVIVAYRSAELVDELLQSLGPTVPAVVIDNFHGADGLEERIKNRPNTRYIDGPGAGWAAAVNIAVASSDFDVFVTAGPDSRPTAEQLDALVADVRADPTVAQSCSTAVEPGGRVELGAAGWEPTWRRAFVHASGLHYLLPQAGLWARPEPGEDIDIDWCNGNVAATSRSLLLELGGFDDAFFVYNDDVDISRRIRQAGYTQLLRTDVLVPHRSGSSGEKPTRMSQMRGSSMMIDVGRHHGTVETQAIRVILSIGAGVRALAYRALQRPANARWHEAYVRGLWVGPPAM